MINKQPFFAVTTSGILGAGNRCEIRWTPGDLYLIMRATGKDGKLHDTDPMTLWLRPTEFTVEVSA